MGILGRMGKGVMGGIDKGIIVGAPVAAALGGGASALRGDEADEIFGNALGGAGLAGGLGALGGGAIGAVGGAMAHGQHQAEARAIFEAALDAMRNQDNQTLKSLYREAMDRGHDGLANNIANYIKSVSRR